MLLLVVTEPWGDLGTGSLKALHSLAGCLNMLRDDKTRSATPPIQSMGYIRSERITSYSSITVHLSIIVHHGEYIIHSGSNVQLETRRDLLVSRGHY